MKEILNEYYLLVSSFIKLFPFIHSLIHFFSHLISFVVTGLLVFSEPGECSAILHGNIWDKLNLRVKTRDEDEVDLIASLGELAKLAKIELGEKLRPKPDQIFQKSNTLYIPLYVNTILRL